MRSLFFSSSNAPLLSLAVLLLWCTPLHQAKRIRGAGKLPQQQQQQQQQQSQQAHLQRQAKGRHLAIPPELAREHVQRQLELQQRQHAALLHQQQAQQQRKLANEDSGFGEEEWAEETPFPTVKPTSPPTNSPTTASPTSSPTTTVATTTPAPTSRTKSDIELYLGENCAIWGGIEFYDEATYWMKALRFVEQTATDDMEDWRICQRYVLSCIYFATNGLPTPYTDDLFGEGLEGFAFDWLRKWADGTEEENECEWWGVVCQDDDGVVGNYGNVTELNLAANWLMGQFPGEVYFLKDTLEVLDLEYNLVSNMGKTHNWFFQYLENLQVLNLGKTGFGFENQGLPPYFAQLTNLVELNVYSTLYYGPLNETIFTNLVNLEYLDMGALEFSSPLPLTLKDLPNLKYIYMDYCDFYGDLQDFLDGTGFPSLLELWMDDNPDIDSPIPETMDSYLTLQSLSMTNCGLYGEIPESMGLLSGMKQLWLYHNFLNGTIPQELGNLGLLERLQLYDNDLTGDMPADVCANRFGFLGTLGSDCHADDPQVACPCCTCCGSECA